MLTNLEINNGILSPKFDIYNDTYTVTIDKDIKKLDISYQLVNDNISVIINNNENLEEEKQVSIILRENDITKTITLNVIHDLSESSAGLTEYFKALEIKKREEISPYVAPIIGVSCFLIILIAFSILFHKKRN